MLEIEKCGNFISFPAPREQRQNEVVFLKGTRTRNDVYTVPELEVECMPQHAAQCGTPVRTLSLKECLMALSCAHTGIFSLWQERCHRRSREDVQQVQELGHLKTKQKKMGLWRKEEREQKLARSENPGWIFTSFFSSKNLKPSALYKPWTCSNSSFVDFPDNRAAESHLIHLWDLVRTSKYNRLQNTWNCWQRKHFLPNSVGQQTQSRPCNYIPPRSTFAAM